MMMLLLGARLLNLMNNALLNHHHSIMADIPAVDHNGVVTSPTLHLDDLLYHSNNGLHVSALALWVPVLYVQLSHFVYRNLFSVRLKETSMCSLVNFTFKHIALPVD